MHDAALARRIPTVFVPEGEALLTLRLGNLEHFINHKYQLFAYFENAQRTTGQPAISTFGEDAKAIRPLRRREAQADDLVRALLRGVK